MRYLWKKDSRYSILQPGPEVCIYSFHQGELAQVAVTSNTCYDLAGNTLQRVVRDYNRQLLMDIGIQLLKPPVDEPVKSTADETEKFWKTISLISVGPLR